MVGEGISLLSRGTLPKRDEVDFFPLYNFSQKTSRHLSLAVGLLERPAYRLTDFTLYVIYAIYLHISSG